MEAPAPISTDASPHRAPTRPEEVLAVVAKARGAQRAWGELSIGARIKALAPAKDRLLDRAAAIATLLHEEIGKPETEALLSEVLPSADVFAYWSRSIEELLEPAEIDLDAVSYPGKSGVIYREARGVVALISPWNFPFALPLRTIVPALLAGNAVVFKPSEVAPRAGALIAEIFDGLVPSGVFSILQGAGDVGEALCAADVDLVCFTGSVATGKKVARACAEKLIPASLELGGKDAAIVLADANLERAANGVVWGALMNAGQNCASVERVYVEQSVADAFQAKVVAAVGALRKEDLAPLATDAQKAIVRRHVDAAKDAGAKVLAGGEDGEGKAYAPTVLRVESDDLDVMAEETFGPVLPIAIVKDAEEAIARANASRYGLTASVWSKDVKRAEQIARRLRAGVVTINNHAFTGALPAAPWSGVGETGYGITNSPLALEALTRPRFVLVDRSRAKRELWWYPYTPAQRTIALAMASLRSGTVGLFGKIGAFFRLLGAFPKRMKMS